MLCLIFLNQLFNKKGIGEGVYIGTAVTNWDAENMPDLSNRNQIINNHFGPYVTAEAIDIKEATSENIIDGNYFDGIGMSGEHFGDSWVDVKGHKNIISNNRGSHSILDGFQVHDQRKLFMNSEQAKLYPSGCDNEFINNICSNLGSKGVCVQLKSVTACSNQNINNVNLDLLDSSLIGK